MLYPLKFSPILKEKLWGGKKLQKIFSKSNECSKIGESWEISAVKGSFSIVSNGYLKGKNIQQLIKTYKSDFLGQKVHEIFGDEFPLLIKILDAHKDLSIQVHPHNELAKKRHNSFGKNEMWYVMQADENSEIIVGFKNNTTEKEYLKCLNDKKLNDILNIEKVKQGDVYFIPTGRVHAIGAGIVVAEIQQTSDITYRIYDWERKDKNGNQRELHTDLALGTIDYTVQKEYKLLYDKKTNCSNQMVDCKYFTTNFIPLHEIVKLNYKQIDSFVIYICVKGKVDIIYENNTETIKIGETILLPASLNNIILKSENAEILEVYLK